MQALAEKYADVAHFPFVYIREAHPGEVYSPHESLDQKMRHAWALRELGKKTPILIDTLYGHVHRAYGGPSNMTLIMDATGHIAYRAAWTVAEDIEAALVEIIEMRVRRKEGKSVSTYYREMLGMHVNHGPQRFLGGKKAEEDFNRARAAQNSQEQDGKEA